MTLLHRYLSATAVALLLATSSMGCRPSVGAGASRADSLDVLVVDTVEARPEALASDGGTIALPAVLQRILVRRDSLWRRAMNLHFDAIVIDGHIDTPTLMLEQGYRLGNRHHARGSHVDLPRMYEGGLDAAFFSLYVAPGYGEGQAAVDRVSRLIDVVERQVRDLPDSLALAYSAEDVIRITQGGRKAVLLGLEGGHALGASEEILETLYAKGVRYVTVTHINSNSWADASQSRPRWNGLNDRGRDLIRAMNQLGMIVDLSHTSDSTFFDALEVSNAPVLLSHSSARSITAGVRNASDEMLRALSENGGVIMINFFDAMVNPAVDADVMADVHARLPDGSLTHLWNTVYTVRRERGLPGATLENVVDHIDHAVRIAGIDHVGLGSDFDGVFDLPAGLDDVTRLPWITYELVRRGYSDEDIRKILGANVLRLMREVDSYAKTSAFQTEED